MCVCKIALTKLFFITANYSQFFLFLLYLVLVFYFKNEKIGCYFKNKKIGCYLIVIKINVLRTEI